MGIQELVGKTILLIERRTACRSERLIFITGRHDEEDSEHYVMRPSEARAECPKITSVDGDLQDVLSSEVIEAVDISDSSMPGDENSTRTVYRIRTLRGAITINWSGVCKVQFESYGVRRA